MYSYYFEKKENSPFQIQKELGLMSYGTVYLVYDERDSKNKVLRVFDLMEVVTDDRLKSFLEIFNQRKDLGHDNIAKFFEVTTYNGFIATTSEYIEGESLFSYINNLGGSPPSKDFLGTIINNLADIFSHLIEKEIFIYELTSENIILKPDGTCVLVDIGVSTHLSNPSKRYNGNNIAKKNFSVEYLPASHDCKTKYIYTYKLGVILLELISGRKLSESLSFGEKLSPRVDKKAIFKSHNISKEYKKLAGLIKLTLSKNEKERMNHPRIFRGKFLNGLSLWDQLRILFV